MIFVGITLDVVRDVHHAERVAAAELAGAAGVGLDPAVEVEDRVAVLVVLDVGDDRGGRVEEAAGVEAVGDAPVPRAARHRVEERGSEELAALVDAEHVLDVEAAHPRRHELVAGGCSLAASIFARQTLALIVAMKLPVVVAFDTPAGQAACTTLPSRVAHLDRPLEARRRPGHVEAEVGQHGGDRRADAGRAGAVDHRRGLVGGLGEVEDEAVVVLRHRDHDRVDCRRTRCSRGASRCRSAARAGGR